MAATYLYNGFSLRSYCKRNNLCYSSKVRQIKETKEKNPDISDEEIIRRVMEDSVKRDKYFYKGMSLRKYCQINKINYDVIAKRISRIKNKNLSISDEELVNLALQQESWTKYYYNGETLYQFCKCNGFNIDDVTRRFKRLIDREQKTLEQAISDTIKYYQRKEYLKNITKIFLYLKSSQDVEDESLKKIIEYLNINYNNFKHLRYEMRFDNLTSIALIWHFHDNSDNDSLSISKGKLKEILYFVKSLSNVSEKDASNLDFGYLFGVYKTRLYDTRYLLLMRQENFIYYTIYRVKDEFNLNLNREKIMDIYNNVSIYFLELLEKIDNNVVPSVITYMTKAIRGYIIDCFIKIKEDSKSICIDCTTKNGEECRSLLEKIPNKKRSKKGFDNETLDILSDLDVEYKKFIIYKYQEELSYEEIAFLLDIDIECVKNLEHTLLCQLREDEKIKNFLLSRVRKNNYKF